jgi:hypothetical protein
MNQYQHRIRGVAACIVVAACLMPQVVLTQVNPRIGSWKLDLAQSTYQQGQAPTGETLTYLAAADGALQLTADAVLPGGTKRPSGYRAKYDGQDYPYSSGVGDTIAITGDGWSSDATIKMRGKVTQTTHSVVSQDGKTMTVVATTASGRAVSTRVYHKQ